MNDHFDVATRHRCAPIWASCLFVGRVAAVVTYTHIIIIRKFWYDTTRLLGWPWQWQWAVSLVVGPRTMYRSLSRAVRRLLAALVLINWVSPFTAVYHIILYGPMMQRALHSCTFCSARYAPVDRWAMLDPVISCNRFCRPITYQIAATGRRQRKMRGRVAINRTTLSGPPLTL